VINEIKKKMPLYTSAIWEELCRQSVPFIIGSKEFNPASRWWSKGSGRNQMEIDIVAESTDKKEIIVGEAKWSEKTNLNNEAEELKRKISDLPFIGIRNIIPVLFVKHKPASLPKGIMVFGPEDVVKSLEDQC
jgi:hypothetical protein